MPINLPKELPQPILLKLAEDLQSVDKEAQMDEWDNVLVLVRPLASYDGLVTIMEDSESDWRVTEPFDLTSKDGYISALVTGMPPKGKFTLVLSHLGGEDSAVMMFEGLTYQEIIAEPPELPMISKHEEQRVPDEVNEERERQKKTLDMMLGLINGN